jgi:hypothetical protein
MAQAAPAPTKVGIEGNLQASQIMKTEDAGKTDIDRLIEDATINSMRTTNIPLAWYMQSLFDPKDSSQVLAVKIVSGEPVYQEEYRQEMTDKGARWSRIAEGDDAHQS